MYCACCVQAGYSSLCLY